MPRVTPLETYRVQPGDTLESIATAKCDGDWQRLVRYNFFTKEPREIVRALVETIGVKLGDLITPTAPEKLPLTPDPDLTPSLRIPAVLTKETLPTAQVHTMTVRFRAPAVAVEIEELDRWFVPGSEACALTYRPYAEPRCADALQVDVFGSNYCECTGWSDGLGTWGDPAALADEPVFTKDLSAVARVSSSNGLPGEGWKGEVTTAKGMLGRKTGKAAARHVNVAFSPYTVHFRYWKKGEAGDAKARLVLEPFWPQWDATISAPAVTPTVDADKVTLAWTGAADAERGAVTITDVPERRVYFAVLTGDALKSGARTHVWDRKYNTGLTNTLFEGEYLDDAADNATVATRTRTRTSTRTNTTVTDCSSTGTYDPVAQAWGTPVDARGAPAVTNSAWSHAYGDWSAWSALTLSGDTTAGSTESEVAATPTTAPDGATQQTATTRTQPDPFSYVDEWTDTDSEIETETAVQTETRTMILPSPRNAPYAYEVKTVVSVVKSATLKVKWAVEGTTRLERGVLRIVDGANKIVFQKALKKSLLEEGAHELAWDGKYDEAVVNSKGGKAAIPADMPYRVKLEAHTGARVAKGLALAAMHTEVRLYVHPAALAPWDFMYDPATAKPSLTLGLAPTVPGTPPADTAGTRWYQHKLAEHGFHPGPVNGTATSPPYALALAEMLRTAPAYQATPAPFTRLAIEATAAANERTDTKAALLHLPDRCKRPLFGDPAKVESNQDAPDLAAGEVAARLADGAGEVIVWVDDRHCFTNPGASDPADETGFGFLSGADGRPAARALVDAAGSSAGGAAWGAWTSAAPLSQQKTAENARDAAIAVERAKHVDPTKAANAKLFNMGDYRGTMDVGDDRPAKDAASIARPWVPLQADLILVGRASSLGDEVAAPGDDLRAASRRAIGPLRVDWTFDELPPDLSVIDPSHPHYDRKEMRTRVFTAWALAENAGTHERKDTKDPQASGAGPTTVYRNCREDFGGIRPASGLGAYYKAAFGHHDGAADTGLAPWKGTAVDATESIATVVHDHLVAGQTADVDLFEPRIGLAGTYFRPSTVAGDGYRVAAAVRFEEASGSITFPNLATLAARYPVPPRAQSARLRVWRKGSIRGFIRWGPTTSTGPARANWGPTYIDAVRAFYRPAHIYYVHEAGARTEIRISDVMDQALFEGIVKANCELTAEQEGRLAFNPEYVWPWCDADDFGWEKPWASDLDSVRSELSNKTWSRYRPAMGLALIREVEKKYGYLRGDLLVEFEGSPTFEAQKFTCDADPSHEFHFLSKDGTARVPSDPCPCGGTLALSSATPQPRLSCDAGAMGLGLTWVYYPNTADDEKVLTPSVLQQTWAHEMAHQRHFEHAATATDKDSSGAYVEAKWNLHDRKRNHTNPGWDALDEQWIQWSRRCVMSYSHIAIGRPNDQYFCGKCVLRLRGWKVLALDGPDVDVGEP